MYIYVCIYIYIYVLLYVTQLMSGNHNLQIYMLGHQSYKLVARTPSTRQDGCADSQRSFGQPRLMMMIIITIISFVITMVIITYYCDSDYDYDGGGGGRRHRGGGNDDSNEEGMDTCSVQVGYLISCVNPKANPNSGMVLLPIRNAMLTSSTRFHLSAIEIHWSLRYSVSGQTTVCA